MYFHMAIEKLKKTDMILLTGNPGDGQSNVAYHCVKQLSQTPWVVYTLEDLFKIGPQNNLAILVDGTFDQISTSNDAKEMLQRLSFIRGRNDSNKIIVVMQKEVLNYLRNKIRDAEWLPENEIIDFSKIHLSNELSLKFSDKLQRTETEDTSAVQNSYFKMSCSDNSQPIETQQECFNTKLKIYKKHFRNMEQMPFMVLSFIAMNGVLNIRSFQRGLPDEKFLENLSILLGTKCMRTQANLMYELAQAFEGVYLSYESRYRGYFYVSKCIHDAICSVLFEKNPWKFIEMCSLRHLLEISANVERKKYISRDIIKCIISRILWELKVNPSSELFQSLWKFDIWEDEIFLELIGNRFSLSVQNMSETLQKEFFSFSRTNKNTPLISFLFFNIPEIIFKRVSNIRPIRMEIALDENRHGSSDIELCINRFESSIKYKPEFRCFRRHLKRAHSEETLSKYLVLNPSNPLFCIQNKPISRCSICRLDLALDTQLKFDKERFKSFNVLFSEMNEYKELTSHNIICEFFGSQAKINTFGHSLIEEKLKAENEKYILGGVHVLGSEGLNWLKTAFHKAVQYGGNGKREIMRNIVIKTFVRSHGNKCKINSIWIGKSCLGNKKAEDTLVVIHKSEERVDLPTTFLGLSLIVRSHREVSTEAKSLLTHELKSHSKILDIKDGEITNLLKSHSNITLISTSSVRSKKYGTALQEVEYTPCIVIYCMIKGVIPDGESKFPSEIGGHPVDVREGFCSFANNAKPLQIGDKIYSDKSMQYGTLGGFVDIDTNSKGFITCAHVLCPVEILERGNHSHYFRRQEHYVFDTSKNESRDEPIGTVLRGVIDHNDPNKVSVDAAIVKITTRCPENGKFPNQGRMQLKQLEQAGFTDAQIPNFSNGEIGFITTSNMKDCVIKFGAKSGLTVGFLRMENAHAMITKETNIVLRYSTNSDDAFKFKLFKQYEVFPMIDENTKNSPFFEKGDSGAFIFMITKENPPRLKCIGLGVAVTSHGSCIMTPIEEVLQSLKLGEESLSKFQSEESDGEENVSNMVGLDTIQNMMTNMTEILTQNFTSQFDEIRSDLQTNGESVKELKNAMKTTNTTLENIQQQMDKSSQDMKEIKERVSELETK
ncbi:uncharacterized protein LOC134234912 [Saccostrea cucullata]|uniref:uncharacterized protein LOC134234912 n=1 Tax=Saccostrea cuccullata TaxID=36930 RepID=UPI002ED1C80B